jgi:hypothetical protein
MAKAVFQKNQKVWVESVGAWATIDRIVPIWAKGFDEPVRVTYDVGLGREFHAHELKPEDKVEDADGALPGEGWRLMRAKNKWQQEGDCAHHPFPGTYPIVVTDEADWGGWRTPGRGIRPRSEQDGAPGPADRQRPAPAGHRPRADRHGLGVPRGRPARRGGAGPPGGDHRALCRGGPGRRLACR